MTERLDDLLRRRDEIGRYELFLSHFTDEDGGKRDLLRSAFDEADVLLKLQILQYLAEIPEERAVDWILSRLEDESVAVWRAAARAFRANHYSKKNLLLRRFVMSKDERAARFAIRTLARAGNRDALPVLLAHLDEAPLAIRGEILNALRFMPDTESVSRLLPFTEDRGEETRFRAVRTLAELRRRGIPVPERVFQKLSEDASAKIRHAALDGLKSYASREVMKAFLARLSDPDEPVEARVRAIEALASFPHRDWVPSFVLAMRDANDSRIRLGAEIALRRTPRESLKPGLLSLLDSPDHSIVTQSAILLAETMGDDPEIRRILVARWRAAKDDEERLRMLDVLRELGDPSLIDELIQTLKQSPLLAYSAIGVLNRLWSDDSGPTILALLDDDAVPQFAKQALLGWIVRKGPPEEIRDELHGRLLEGLESGVVNIRYLSAQILAYYPAEGNREALVAALEREDDDAVVSTIRSLLVDGLGRDPLPLIEAVKARGAAEPLTLGLATMLRMRAWNPDLAYPVLLGISRPPVSLPECDEAAFIGTLLHLVETESILFQEAWLFVAEEQLQKDFLEGLRDAMRDPARDFPPMPLEFLAFHLESGRPEERRFFYELLRLDDRDQGVPILVRMLLEEEDDAALEEGRRQLRVLAREAAA
jgi:HEAT repeat protein